MQLHGLHHVTAVSARIGVNYDFYTHVMGMRLVKKTVNQDDVTAYHLFYADKVGSPGTDMTFFDWPQTGADQRGTDSIVTTAFRVNGRDALDYWAARLRQQGVSHEGVQTIDGRGMLRFDDPEGQRLLLVDDNNAPYEGEIWDGSDVPAEHALRGFYAITLSVPDIQMTHAILTQVLNFKAARSFEDTDGTELLIYEMDGGGPGREVWVRVEPHLRRAWPGAGSVHHAAFRVKDFEEQQKWRKQITSVGLPVSEFIDRYYFRSIYFRISNGILFEIATDGPGFTADEELETLGEELALPPFLEPKRAAIEAGLKPIVTPNQQ